MNWLKNPYVASVICMVLFAVMYNNATTAFMRACSYVPLAVVLVLFLKSVYQAYFKNK